MFEKEKRCEKCGETFGCGGLLGCWCRDVKLDTATLALLKERYNDCLCPECLKAMVVTVRDDDATRVL